MRAQRSCEKFPDSFVLDYLRQEAEEQAAEEFAAHVETCPECQERLEELQLLLPKIKGIAAATDIRPSEKMKSHLMEEAGKLLAEREKPGKEQVTIVPFLRRMLQYGIAAAVILVVWWTVGAMRGTGPRDSVIAAAITDVDGPLRIERAPENQDAAAGCVCPGDRIIAGSEPASFTYDGHFRVQLQPSSALSVEPGEAGEASLLRLSQGEMRADSCRCEEPVRILTPAGVVGCADGEFSLRMEQGGGIRVTVHKGDADVRCPGCGKAHCRVKAGQEMVVSESASRGCGCGCGMR